MQIKLFFLLIISTILFFSCASADNWSKAQEITLGEFLGIRDAHTYSHTIYCGSDSTYHYFKKVVLFERDKEYKLKRSALTLSEEFSIEENRKPILTPLFSETPKEYSGSLIPIEYYADSVHIGQSGYNKVELSRYVNDGPYVIIKFFTKAPDTQWVLKQEFTFEKDFISDCDMQISDFNNDGLGDMTYVSDVAARGANEIRRLFIYDKNTDRLIYLKNSESFPNMTYNNKLNCINSFAVYGCCATTFLGVQADSLNAFASVEFCEDGELTVSKYDKYGNEKIIKKEISDKFEQFVPFENYNPPKQ